ncbi:MAG TPA: hypothetical protein VIF40_14710 [Methylosinus sp.]|jgi:hypothetical protein|uniref:hypothetical protein n=1 Tax=Methylosinus sp. TaxID=427 RepID=UPI002F92DE0C
MDAVLRGLCFFCTVVTGAPEPAIPRGDGDIWFSHETIGADTHVLRLSASDLLLDVASARRERLDAFARRLAAEICSDRFELFDAQRASWPEAPPTYARQYVVRCR